MKSKKIVSRFNLDQIKYLNDNEIEDSYLISEEQLYSAKLFQSREKYIYTLPKNIRYMEVGVAWGYYSKIVAEITNPASIHLLDLYNQENKCWAQRANEECNCISENGHGYYNPDTHENFIKEKFSIYNNVLTLKGYALGILKNIKNKYDYIYIDITNDRKSTRDVIWESSKLIEVNGIMGINDYIIYDGIIDNKAYGTYQSVNEFLHFNKNWIVDAIALHPIGFYDIYIRKIS